MVWPAKAPAFEEIRLGLEERVAPRLKIHVILASDFQGKPGGVVEAALGHRPVTVLPIGTVLACAFLAATETRATPPIIAVAVTNALDVLPAEQIQPPRTLPATVVLDGPATIYSGTATLIADIIRPCKRIGTVFNPHEANSLSNLERIKFEAQRREWVVIEKPIESPSDVRLVARALLDEGVDAIWVGKDRIMTSNPQPLIELVHANGVPVFASDAGTVSGFHAVGTRSVSFRELGRFVGDRLLEVLGGRDVRTMPVSTVEETRIFLSRSALQLLHLEIPAAVAAEAVFVDAPGAEPQVDGTIHRLLFAFLAVAVGAVILLWARRTRHSGHRHGI